MGKELTKRNKPTIGQRTTRGRLAWGEPSDGKTADWYLQIASAHEILKHDEMVELFKTYALGGPNGRKAYHRIAKHNLRLVASVARSYTQLGVDREDILQEGNMGLLHAIEKYDYTTGNKFSTYALWWIRQRISHFIATQRQSIRLPAHAMRLRKRIEVAVQEYQILEGCFPSAEELAIATGGSVDIVRAAMAGSKKLASLDSFSRNANNDHEETDTKLSEELESNEVSQETLCQYEELGRHALRAFEHLNPKDQEIIRKSLLNRKKIVDDTDD